MFNRVVVYKEAGPGGCFLPSEGRFGNQTSVSVDLKSDSPDLMVNLARRAFISIAETSNDRPLARRALTAIQHTCLINPGLFYTENND